ncbi:RsbRD N-terminal domain-containing protein [Desulfogranum mediterraneum]|uniref:RsbRD N-terminal domain-containing protein n=1 Tax=Desulfogranum mediterraneum TaxID=160661 RepID=UPI000428081D|nr:RsbRD N-terminal domain-containing protein [Desulfogranum mediterraneum]
MELTEALQHKQKDIHALWLDRTLNSYVSPGFFKKAKDPFANPVGVNISKALESIFSLLVARAEQSEFSQPLDQIIRIRAVQDFTPAQAVAPLLELKWVIKEIFKKNDKTRDLLSQLDNFDCEIDRVALAGFDIYTECREQLHRCRIRELKSGSHLITDGGCPSRLLDKETALADNKQSDK